MAGFFGSYSGTLDSKNRLHLPARLRQASDDALETCYLSWGGRGGALILYPKDEWRRVEARFVSFARSNPETGPDVHRVLMANTFEVTPDRQGRIQIPTELISKAGINKDVKVLGVSQRIEIWAAETLSESMAQYEKTYEEIASKLLL